MTAVTSCENDLYLGIETVSCRRHGLKREKVRPAFSSVTSMAALTFSLILVI